MSAAASVTEEELVARAHALVPVLAERAAHAEDLRRIPDETIADLRQSGLLRIAKPACFGGYGLDFDTVWEVGYRLALGCGSTAWVYMVSQIHDYQAGVAPPGAQDAFFRSEERRV